MGDIADGILNGDFDQYTGEYLGEGDGYPRTSKDIQTQKSRKNKSIRKAGQKIVFHTKLLNAGIPCRVLNDGSHLQINKHLNIYPTTGKWYNSETGDKGFTSDPVEIYNKFYGKSEKNAKLIAAAPELLEVLEKVKVGYEWHIDNDSADKADFEMYDEICNVIKKATE